MPSGKRTRFLDEACDGDSELRREVETLLLHDGRDEAIRGAVDAVADLVSQDTASSNETTLEGSRIGPYQVTGLIGHGGMGAVYRAIRADDAFRKQVAIKLVRRGLNSDAVVSRFRRERQILASLEHPHIAHLLDGGSTADGLPYFVMEYVEDGLPITEHCDRLKLTVEERLRLFLPVCDAVRHAHQNLVIHRDLKPTNILVNGEGTPKLLDFGIAKLLQTDPAADAEHYTQTGVRLLTPDYASPEQVRGEAVTTATDVYLLGAVLFEMLTGQRAQQFRDYSDAEIARVVCLAEIERPSAAAARATAGDPRRRRLLERRLQGDVDAIILMAMRKEPEHRYQSVEQFVADIRRHLEGRPVRARKGTWRYRAAKFVSRHRLAAVAGILVASSVVAGSTTTVWQARRAGQQARLVQMQADRAQRRFEQVRGLARTMLFDLHDQIRDLPGATAARQKLVTVGLEYLDSLAREAGGDTELQWELSEAYYRVAQVQGSPNYPSLGQRGAAMESLRRSIAILEAIERSDTANTRVVKALYRAWETAGDLSAHAGAIQDSREYYQRAVLYSGRYATLAPSDPSAIALAARAQASWAGNARRQGDKMAALAGFRKSLELNEAWAILEPASLPARRAIANSHERLGLAYQELGDLTRAERHSSKALDLVEKIAALPEANSRDRERVAGACQRAGDVHGHARMANTGNHRLARRYYTRKNEIYAGMTKADPHDAQAREELAFSWYELGNTWREENPKRAAEMYGHALAFAEPAARKEAAMGNLWSFAGQVRAALAYVTFRQGRREEAVATAKQAVEMLEKVAAVPGGPAGEKHHLALAHASLAGLLAESGDAGAAAAHYRRAVELVRPLADRHDAGAEAALTAWRNQAGSIERRLQSLASPARSAGSGE